MTLTPFGLRPSECVMEQPNGATVSEGPKGYLRRTMVVEGRITEELIPVPETCHKDGYMERLLQRRNKRTSPVPDGWLDNAGWYPPAGSNNLSYFYSDYTVPGNPTNGNGQVLFFFIGMQDNDNASVNIIQPVLTWGNGVPGWNVASWVCCPSNVTTHSPTLVGFGAGDHIYGTLQRDNTTTWKVDSEVAKTGQHTTLNDQVGALQYNWADVTQEVYSVKTCDQFAVGATIYSKLTLKDQNSNTLSPKWSFTGTTGCNGHITQPDSTTIEIQHN